MNSNIERDKTVFCLGCQVYLFTKDDFFIRYISAEKPYEKLVLYFKDKVLDGYDYCQKVGNSVKEINNYYSTRFSDFRNRNYVLPNAEEIHYETIMETE